MNPLRAAALAVLTAALLPAAVADAKTKRFAVTVKGSQVTTWSYTKIQEPTCDWPEHEAGDQTIKFHDLKVEPIRVTAKRAPNGGLVLRSKKPMALAADAELNRDFDVRYSQQSACPGGGPFGGGTPPEDAVGQEHCEIDGLLEWRMGPTRDSIYDPGDPLRGDGKSSFPNGLFFRGVAHWPVPGSYPTLPGACEHAGQGNADTGITVDFGEHNGNLVEGFEEVPAKKLLGPKAKRVVKVSGSEEIDYPNGTYAEQPREKTTGHTIFAYNITFRRLGR